MANKIGNEGEKQEGELVVKVKSMDYLLQGWRHRYSLGRITFQGKKLKWACTLLNLLKLVNRIV